MVKLTIVNSNDKDDKIELDNINADRTTMGTVMEMVQAKKGFEDNTMKLVYNAKRVEPFRSVRDYSETRGEITLYIAPRIKGGGKRAKMDANNNNENKQQGDIPIVYAPPVRQPDDVAVVGAALAIANVNITGWLDSLDVSTLVELQTKFDTSVKASSHIDKHVHTVVGFIKEYMDLQVIMRGKSVRPGGPVGPRWWSGPGGPNG